MAALNRLQQRIKENFHETTRDITLLAAPTAPSASYFDSASSTTEEKLAEIAKLLESRNERERLDGMKHVIAGISRGRDMERFFAQVVKNVVASSIEIRKLVYIYLLRFASTNSDLLLLSINTFQKDLSDPSPLIRSMSLRVLTSIRVPVIQGIVMLGLKKLVNDRNPWVRKTVAGGLAKVYDSDSSSLPQLLPLLQILLASPSPLTLGATLTAFTEICPERLDLLHPYYRHICRTLVDADEWGQVVALEILTRYARMMLEKPESPVSHTTNGNEVEEDEFEGMDMDLAMLLDYARPLFQSRNPAVVLGTAKLYFHLAPAGLSIVGRELLVAPILRLAGDNESREVRAIAWEVIANMVGEEPAMFMARHSRFFLHEGDSDAVKTTKLRAMMGLVTDDNALISLREFRHYARSSSDAVAEAAVRAIGQCVRTQATVAAKGLSTLMKLLNSQRDVLVAQAVIVLKSVVLAQASSTRSSTSIPNPQRLVARLAKGLDGITHPKARASVFWLVGQYAAQEGDDGKSLLSVGWDGVANWVPDILRKGIKGFIGEARFVKLQVLTLASKLLVLSPGTAQLVQMSGYLFTLARYDQDYDVRDRGRFLYALLRGVRSEKITSKLDGENGGDDGRSGEDDEAGGVVLRREQVKVVLLGQREAEHDMEHSGTGSEYNVASMSRITKKKLAGYEDLPEWTHEPTDASLRDSELDKPTTASSVPVTSISSTSAAAPPTTHLAAVPVPPHVASSSSLARSNTSSPAASLPPRGAPVADPGSRSKFQDLDAFLNSESEEEETESDNDSEEEVRPRAVTALPRGAIVPEYDDESSDADDGVDDEDSDEGEHTSRLLR